MEIIVAIIVVVIIFWLWSEGILDLIFGSKQPEGRPSGTLYMCTNKERHKNQHSWSFYASSIGMPTCPQCGSTMHIFKVEDDRRQPSYDDWRGDIKAEIAKANRDVALRKAPEDRTMWDEYDIRRGDEADRR